MEFKVLKIDPHKRRCDDCGSSPGPFHECQFPYTLRKDGSYGRSCWCDLCPACIEARRLDPRPLITLETVNERILRVPENPGVAAPTAVLTASRASSG